MRHIALPALLTGLLAAGVALAPAPAVAQSYDRDRAEVFGRGDRGWFEDRERYARDQYERGYRTGRDDERRASEERVRRGSYGRGEGYRSYGARERDRGWFSGDGLFD